ncbi:nucleotidyl transferase AbiEii/AbiGii toxin family protein [Noviherbaspirillum sp. CPCC 100848]|uniref:Nucleotidyl transferase AbiEii/AbiGii toxin family protein n=1 Tax=Noviherbaspirillum album TaxID=3080276 RepID=A0ABU6JI66_9BURK|nr:nucleotidyl transferase AbiEii/AbiGii toxin family protein [Noviherbaspirillum sp. CPCC 100848]MEC4722774.1 nucleotidyl transferase AbiEii/AbiGii toxin family protein [Noviherbaspirillum sp. CPCC 100848]
MPEAYLSLPAQERAEILAIAADRLDRPATLIEKDFWVVWTLSALFDTPLGQGLTFKGGTSLSKAYRLIDRFSEDIDLTYDIRHLIGDLITNQDSLPSTRSQAKKWTDHVKARLPEWIHDNVIPVIEAGLRRDGLEARCEQGGVDGEKLYIHYDAIKLGTGYVSPSVQLEFGGRATGEPHQKKMITCDMAPLFPQLGFPVAHPLVMTIDRTFWEKATAAHVYCLQERLRGERYARHWYDLATYENTPYLDEALAAHDVRKMVAEHKAMFFIEKDKSGQAIDYHRAVGGHLRLIPEPKGLAALEVDYGAMTDAGILIRNALPFNEIIERCLRIQNTANNQSL